jgi:NAD(P)-dependent dehydrogenase (short-subunit alcohol dehydrogenase family)
VGRFDGATVLITGAAGGLGRGAAKGFADEGARLILSDIDHAALEALAASLGTQTAMLAGNIADEVDPANSFMTGHALAVDGGGGAI